MAIKTVLACLTTEDHAATLTKGAIAVARRQNAHLVGLHTLESLEVYPGIAVHLTTDVFRVFNAQQQRDADAIRTIFEELTENEDFVSEYRLLKAQSDTASDRMIESARAADVVLMAQEDRDVERYDQRHAQSAVIRQCGRPVIVVPNDFDGESIGKKIVIGWSETREAARAAHDAVMLAQPGAEITVLRVQNRATDEMQDADLLDLSAALARHGLEVTVRHVEASGNSVADVLMKTAFEVGADLVATGAFGHSRAYDFVVGATTTALLKTANIPVLFSK